MTVSPGCIRNHSPDLLNSIERIIAVRATLYAHMPVAGREDAHEWQIRLSRTLIGLAPDGFFGPPLNYGGTALMMLALYISSASSACGLGALIPGAGLL